MSKPLPTNHNELHDCLYAYAMGFKDGYVHGDCKDLFVHHPNTLMRHYYREGYDLGVDEYWDDNRGEERE